MSEKNQIDEASMIQHAREWLNDNGHPSYSYLKKLADDGTLESRDRLLYLAEQYNISYNTSTTMSELVEKIWLFINIDPDE